MSAAAAIIDLPTGTVNGFHHSDVAAEGMEAPASEQSTVATQPASTAKLARRAAEKSTETPKRYPPSPRGISK